jgi:hypothetical protein
VINQKMPIQEREQDKHHIIGQFLLELGFIKYVGDILYKRVMHHLNFNAMLVKGQFVLEKNNSLSKLYRNLCMK